MQLPAIFLLQAENKNSKITEHSTSAMIILSNDCLRLEIILDYFLNGFNTKHWIKVYYQNHF